MTRVWVSEWVCVWVCVCVCVCVKGVQAHRKPLWWTAVYSRCINSVFISSGQEIGFVNVLRPVMGFCFSLLQHTHELSHSLPFLVIVWLTASVKNPSTMSSGTGSSPVASLWVLWLLCGAGFCERPLFSSYGVYVEVQTWLSVVFLWKGDQHQYWQESWEQCNTFFRLNPTVLKVKDIRD